MSPWVRSLRKIVDIWPAVVLGEPSAQRFVLHATDGELSACKGQKKGFVVLVEEVESAIRPCLLVNSPHDSVELVDAVAGIVDGGQKFQVAPVGGTCRSVSGNATTAFLTATVKVRTWHRYRVARLQGRSWNLWPV